MNAASTVSFGAELGAQSTTWPQLRDAALRAEAAGFESLWTWDHLLAVYGPWQQPVLEGWTTLAALAPLTSRISLGLLVAANTFRNPGLTAKLATTLDQLSAGRATLGIGGAWFEREHDAFGLEAWAGAGERLDRLDEAVALVRRLLDGERVTHSGRFYQLHEAVCEPRPVQQHLPILVGGSGPRKTLRTVARRADMWNTSGTLNEVRVKVGNLERHLAEAGRDPASVARTISFPIILRDGRPAAERGFQAVLRENRSPQVARHPPLLGSPAQLAAELRPFLELGFSTIIVRLPAPHDAETIERMPELAAALRDH